MSPRRDPARKTIVFAPVGTEGDVRPFASLARTALDAGHIVRLLVSPDHRELCRSLGVEAIALGRPARDDMETLGKSGNAKPLKAFRTLLAMLRSHCRDQFAEAPVHLHGADLLVASVIHLASHSLAQSQGIPICTAGHVPVLIPSREHPPASVWRMGLPGMVNSALWSMNLRMLDLMMTSTISTERQRLGLPPLQGALHRSFQGPFLLAMDPELAPLPGDAPKSVSCSGYWHRPSMKPLSREVESFLAAGEPPVFIGFGSMADPDPRRTAEIFRETIGRLDRRVVVSQGWAGILSGCEERILSIRHEPHEALFPRTAAVVHHGGAGTTWTAARSGIPQLVVPHLMDQYWWGKRVAALKIGPEPIVRNKLSGQNLLNGLRRALDPELAQRAKDFAKPLVRRDGMSEGLAVLERVIAEGGR